MSGEFTRKPTITHRRKNASLGTISNSSTSPPISNAKPIPNYLKAPAFSCHDMCKYGHGHGSESKWRPPGRPKKRANSGIRGVVLNPELRVSGKKERLKREEVVNESISPPIFVDKEATFVEDATSDAPRGTIEMDMPEEKIFELSDASSICEIKMFGEEPSMNSSPVARRHVYIPLAEDTSEDSLSMKVVVSHSDGMHDDTLTSESDVVVEIPPEDESAKMVELAKNAKVIQSNGSELCNGKRGEIVRKNIERQKVNQVFLKPNVTRKRETVPKDGALKRAGGASIQPRPWETTAMHLTNKPRLSNNSTTRPVKDEGEVKFLKPVKQPAFVKSPTMSLGKLKKGKGPTSRQKNNQSSSGGSTSNSENTKEKTIYMIEVKQEVSTDRNQVKKVTQKGKTSSASSSSVSEKDHSRKKLASQSYTKPPLPPHKMTFHRGKVINMQAETNVPARIKFRRAKSNVINKAEGATGVDKVARKKRESGYFGATKSTPPSGTPAVALRHQDSPQEKNGAAVSLFNHVIEETASKLVETRKSKVKALVGAFETVISLQDKCTVSSPS
jgi:Plant calmodulin-binding domain